MITLMSPEQDQALRLAVLRDDSFNRFVPPPREAPVGEIRENLRRYVRHTPAGEDDRPAPYFRPRDRKSVV